MAGDLAWRGAAAVGAMSGGLGRGSSSSSRTAQDFMHGCGLRSARQVGPGDAAGGSSGYGGYAAPPSLPAGIISDASDPPATLNTVRDAGEPSGPLQAA